MDLQAMDRAHRIGQKKEVQVRARKGGGGGLGLLVQSSQGAVGAWRRGRLGACSRWRSGCVLPPGIGHALAVAALPLLLLLFLVLPSRRRH